MSASSRPVLEAELHAFADGFLSPERRAEIITALERKPAEARRLADWCMQNEAIRRALGKPALDLLPQVQSLAESSPLSARAARASGPGDGRTAVPESDPDAPLPWRAPGRRSMALPSTIGAAILFGMALGFVGAQSLTLWRPVPQRPQVGDFAQDFATRILEAERTFTADPLYPVEIGAGDRTRMLAWFDRRLGEPIAVPDLSRFGLAFVGGRLAATNAGPTAMLLFEGSSGERVAFMIARAGSFTLRPRYVEGHGAGAVVWGDGANLLAVSGAADQPRLMRLAQHISSAPPGP